MDQPAETLESLARQLLDTLPIWVGTGGFAFSFDPRTRRPAFDQIWAWARRYWGIEVVDTQAASWDAIRGLPSGNWLTLLGDAFIDKRLPRLVADAGIIEPLSARRCQFGTVLRAGKGPLLGDLNEFEDMSPYERAAKVLEPALVADPTPFPGMFTDHESTKLWIRRFLEPGLWLEPPAA
jgi:hypothetical protein